MNDGHPIIPKKRQRRISSNQTAGTMTSAPDGNSRVAAAAAKLVAVEDSSNESHDVPEAAKALTEPPTDGNKQPVTGPPKPMAVAYEDSSGESQTRVDRPSPRASVVAVEEEEEDDHEHTDKLTPLVSATEDSSSPDISLGKAVSFQQVTTTTPQERANSLTLSQVFTKDDEIPVPPDRHSTQPTLSQLDLSLTEHHRKGGGILASQRELNVDPREFAAGCIILQAAARGDRAAMEKLLGLNPHHVNFRDYDRRTALHVAASEGHLDICKFLVEEKGCRINRSDRWGGSPLDDAHRHRQENVVKFLRQHGATTGSLDQAANLITAAADGDAEEVALLLSMSNNKHLDAGDYDQRTALHLAAGEGRMDVVRLLCESGANINIQDRWGGRPLDDAKRNRHDDVAEYLESLGAESGDPHNEEEDARKVLEEEDDNMRVEFDELEMIERIGAGAFGEIYKCRWRGTLVAAKCVKSARIRREWLLNHTMSAVKKNKGNVDDVIEAMDNIDEAELTQSQKDEAIADFRQEIRVLRNLRCVQCFAPYYGRRVTLHFVF
jgi:hypothetical protein